MNTHSLLRHRRITATQILVVVTVLLVAFTVLRAHSDHRLHFWERSRDPAGYFLDGTTPPPMEVLLSRVQTTPQRVSVLGYDRSLFGGTWAPHVVDTSACDTRDHVLYQQLHATMTTGCRLRHDPSSSIDPYSGKRWDGATAGVDTAAHRVQEREVPVEDIDIDHVFPLRAAWDSGAHAWDLSKRWTFANDPRNLVATAARLNREKSDALPAEWMPPHREHWCWYSRALAQIAVAYDLSLPEKDVRVMTRACGL